MTIRVGGTREKEEEEEEEKEKEEEEEEGEQQEERRLVVVNVYCPMYDPDRDKDGGTVSRLTVKTNFYRLLESRVAALERAGK